MCVFLNPRQMAKKKHRCHWITHSVISQCGAKHAQTATIMISISGSRHFEDRNWIDWNLKLLLLISRKQCTFLCLKRSSRLVLFCHSPSNTFPSNADLLKYPSNCLTCFFCMHDLFFKSCCWQSDFSSDLSPSLRSCSNRGTILRNVQAQLHLRSFHLSCHGLLPAAFSTFASYAASARSFFWGDWRCPAGQQWTVPQESRALLFKSWTKTAARRVL